MTDDLLFYVIIPIYNGARYIDQCIESIYRQTYSNYRIVMVNDGSVDDSASICDQYAQRDSRVTVLHQENKGQLASRDAAVRYLIKQNIDAEHTYLLFLDVDDQLKTEALSEIRNAIISYNCDMVIFGYERVKEGKILKKYNPEKHFSGCIEDKRILYKIILSDNNYNSMCTKSMSLKLYSDVDYSNYYRVRHGEDLIQSLSYLRNCKKAYFLNKALYNYTVNASSVSQKVNYKNYELDSAVREYVWQFLQDENVWTESDFEDYVLFCQKLLMRKIKAVACFDIPGNERKRMLETMHGNAYYQRILSKGADKNIVLHLFNKKKYMTLCFLIRLLYKPVDIAKRIRS